MKINRPTFFAFAFCCFLAQAGSVSATTTNVLLSIQTSVVAVAATNHPGQFTLASSPPVGNWPVAVTVADVNTDGWPDVISADYFGNTLTVLTNDGTGNFVLDETLPAGNSPDALVAGDLQNNGHLDLICANSGDNTLMVFTNDGRGFFASNATYTVGSAPSAVTLVDVNSNGWLDVICANAQDNTLTVLTNDGRGFFVSNATYAVSADPVSVVAADVNGDGWPDVICANSLDNTLMVLTNNHSGAFGLASTNVVGRTPQAVIAADVNDDGWPDLVSADALDNTLTVLTNNGSGGFGLFAKLNVNHNGVGSDPYSVVAAYAHEHRHLDLISVNLDDNTLTLLTNQVVRSGLTNTIVTGFGYYGTLNVGTRPVSIAAGDVNRDGWVDLITANSADGTLSVLTNTPPGFFYVSGVVISWPTNGTGGFTLQQNADLTTTNWTAVPDTPTVTNGMNTLELGPLTGNSFFRLEHP